MVSWRNGDLHGPHTTRARGEPGCFKMIISNLIGGLGNQLFQYATGLAAARRTGTELRIAIDMFEDYQLHQGFELTRVFAVAPIAANAAEMRVCLGPWRSKQARRLLGRFRPGTLREGSVVVQPTVTYWPGIREVGPMTYLQGYWQSERFFDDAVEEVRTALHFRSPPSEANVHWIRRIESCNSVGLHVRRGDYITNGKNRSIYAVCPPEYYRGAVDHVLQRHPDARFFIFSDEPGWARQLFDDQSGIMEVVDHNRGSESYNDLRLMSRCRHNIIANSTFSWWAAWLLERPGKLIVAPQRWLRSPGLDADMIPARWTRI